MGKLYGALLDAAKGQEECMAVIAPDQSLTFRALTNSVDMFAAAMYAHGIRQNHSVALHVGRRDLLLITFLAANKLGANVFFAGVPAGDFADDDSLVHLTDDPDRKDASLLDQTWLDAGRSMSLKNYVSDENFCVFGTSGSTGSRKFVAMSEDNILNRLAPFGIVLNDETRMLCVIGGATSVSTQIHLAALFRGGSAVMRYGKSPHEIDLFKINTLIATPLIFESMVNLDLPKKTYRAVKKVVFAGVSPSPRLVDRIGENVCEDITIWYGNTEAGPVSYVQYDGANFVPGCVGRPFSDVDVRIVDDDGAEVGRSTEGNVRIRRDNAIKSIIDEDGTDITGRHFSGGYFVPGDRGYLDDQGNLVIVGRDDNVINVSGNKFSIELIEDETEKRFTGNCVVLHQEKAGEGESIVVVLDSAAGFQSQEFESFARKRFPGLAIEAIYLANEIALTDTGKKDRVAMRQLLGDKPEQFKKLH